MADDLHDGLVDNKLAEKTILFSVGHRCTSASLIKEMRHKFETYPFDWVVSKLDVLVHCIETDFTEYLEPLLEVNLTSSSTKQTWHAWVVLAEATGSTTVKVFAPVTVTEPTNPL